MASKLCGGVRFAFFSPLIDTIVFERKKEWTTFCFRGSSEFENEENFSSSKLKAIKARDHDFFTTGSNHRRRNSSVNFFIGHLGFPGYEIIQSLMSIDETLKVRAMENRSLTFLTHKTKSALSYV